MTTIAYRAPFMAADTQETDEAVFRRAPKMVRLPCGGVAGAAGLSVECQKALDWLAGGSKGKPPKIKETSVLIAYGDGRVRMVCDPKWTELPYWDCVSIGSGSQAALAAMNHYAAEAEQAVIAAASVDPNTSAPVQTMRVEPKAKRKK